MSETTATPGVVNTYDSDQPLVNADALLGQTTTVLATKDALTPAGESPTINVSADIAALGTVVVDAQNGGVANVTSVLSAVLSVLDVNADGGTINLDTAVVGVLGATNITIADGGTVNTGTTFLGVLDSSSVTFSGTGNTLNIGPSGTLLNDGSLLNLAFEAGIAGFGIGDVINDDEVAFASVGSYTISTTDGFVPEQVVTFYPGTDGTGTAAGSITFGLGTFSADGTYNAGSGPLTLLSGPGGVLEVTLVCFLRGTHIATSQGEARVEDLKIGDNVATLSNGEIVFKPITWIGSRTVIASKQAADEAFPVRISAGAFAENVPHRDLLLTAEHCLFVDGKLIPARMLVNGGSIIVDRTIRAYTYYHVELAAHSVLLAEGLATESYLDTGNRGNFANAAVPLLQPDFAVHSTHAGWHLAAAPLTVDKDSVEPVWQQLRGRAEHLGLLAHTPAVALTNNPEVHLVTESGLQIRPTLAEGSTYSFLVPGGTETLCLVSRSARPSEVLGPYIDDRRELGVLVGRIDLGIGRKRVAVNAHLSHDSLEGWHIPEAGSASRWTAGNAILPLELGTLKGRPVFLDIELLQAGPYLAASTTTSEVAGLPIAAAA
jgi:hypothetical protein